jgi:hypothetical protein
MAFDRGTSPMMTPPQQSLPAGSLRQIGAAIYDGLLILAVFMVVTFIPVALTGHDLSAAQIGPSLHLMHQLTLLCALGLYYGYAWTRRGQTLGMKAWKIRITDINNGPLNWRKALLRLLIAGLLWLVAIVGVLDYMHRHDRQSLLALVPLLANYFTANLGIQATITDHLSQTRILRD